MTTSPINDPAYWLRRAEEARRTADQLDDPLAKKTLLEIARSYQQLSALTEARLTSKTSK
jgi:hypothetical protein